MFYTSTRNKNLKVTGAEAILKGLSDEGGLFVPTTMPTLDLSSLIDAPLSYRNVAYEVLKLFLTDYTEEELRYCVDNAYDEKFDVPDKVVMKETKGDVYFLELFHGKTIAFKDMALSILPYLMTTAAKKCNLKEKIVILTATSGDTGKAALEGFLDVPGTGITVFYPYGGVSKVQELQMVTTKGSNTKVVAIKGNFDDAQTGVKNIFNDSALKQEMKEKGFVFSSANSINIGRLLPQIAYYVYSYLYLVKNKGLKAGESINVVVPTGNFGNILAAYFAKRMGLPVDKLICASNKNRVLTDFFEEGIYNRNRDFYLTNSPSMDILISSNLERLLYFAAGESDEKVNELMKSLKETGKYELDENMQNFMSDFIAGSADEEETLAAIKNVYETEDYVIDTHTAVGKAVLSKVATKLEKKPVVIASTASPYKFAGAVIKAIAPEYNELTDFEKLDKLEILSKVEKPLAVKEIINAEIRHKTVCEISEMKDVIL